MNKTLRLTIGSLLLFTALDVAFADNNQTTPASYAQLLQLNNQFQTQMKQLQAQQQQQITTLNNQLQQQLKQMQSDFQNQLQKINTQTQAQIQQMQKMLQQQLGQLQQQINQIGKKP